MEAITGRQGYTFRATPPLNVNPIEEVLCCGRTQYAWSQKWMDFWQNRDPLLAMLQGVGVASADETYWDLDESTGYITNSNAGAVRVLTDLYVVDDSDLLGDVHCYSTLEVDGVANFDANVDIDGDLDVLGAALFRSTIEVDGVANFDGAVDIDSTLDVLNGTTLRSTLSVMGIATFDTTVNFDGAVDMDSTLDVLGTALFRSTGEFVGFLQADDGFAAYDNDAAFVEFAFTNQNAGANAEAYIKIISANEYLNALYSADGSGNHGWAIGGGTSSNPFSIFVGNSDIEVLRTDSAGDVYFPNDVVVQGTTGLTVSGGPVTMSGSGKDLLMTGGGDVVLNANSSISLEDTRAWPTAIGMDTDNSTFSAISFYGTSADDYDTLIGDFEGKVSLIGGGESSLGVYFNFSGGSGTSGYRVVKGVSDLAGHRLLYVDE